MSSQVLSDVYEGTAAFGRFQATVALYIGLAFAVVLFICASYNFSQKNDFLPVLADIKENIQCVPKSIGKSTIYNCILNVEYIVSGVKYQGIVNTESDKNFVGQKNIEIIYNPSNPNEIKYEPISPQGAGVFSLISGSVLICVVAIYYYIVQKFKIAAAASGVGTIANIASDVF